MGGFWRRRRPIKRLRCRLQTRRPNRLWRLASRRRDVTSRLVRQPTIRSAHPIAPISPITGDVGFAQRECRRNKSSGSRNGPELAPLTRRPWLHGQKRHSVTRQPAKPPTNRSIRLIAHINRMRVHGGFATNRGLVTVRAARYGRCYHLRPMRRRWLTAEIESMARLSGFVLHMITLAALPQPALADTYLNCLINSSVIISGPHGETLSMRKQHLFFQINDATKTIKFQGKQLKVRRFDPLRITANGEHTSFEIDLKNHTLQYASSITKNGITTIIAGSGSCQLAPFKNRTNKISSRGR